MMRQSIQFNTNQKRFWFIRVTLVTLIATLGLSSVPSLALAYPNDETSVVSSDASPATFENRSAAAAVARQIDDSAVGIVNVAPDMAPPDQLAPLGVSDRQSFRTVGSHTGVQQIILEEFAGTGAGSRAIQVAKCESMFRPGATHHNRNGTVDHGVFQLNDGGTAQGLLKRLGLRWNALYSARQNARMARLLWSETHSFRRWSCG